MGGRQDPGPDDGPGCGGVHRNRKEDEKEADFGLSVGELALSQLVGLPLLPMRGAGTYKCYW